MENKPSSCSTTMTSIAPLRVAGFMEFHVFVTELLTLRTYCMVFRGRRLAGGERWGPGDKENRWTPELT